MFLRLCPKREQLCRKRDFREEKTVFREGEYEALTDKRVEGNHMKRNRYLGATFSVTEEDGVWSLGNSENAAAYNCFRGGTEGRVEIKHLIN